MIYAYVPMRQGWLARLTLGDRTGYGYVTDPAAATGYATYQEVVDVLDAEGLDAGTYQLVRMEFI